MSAELQLIKLSEDHVEQVNQFLRNNAFTEPVMATFNGEKPVEGTVLEDSMEYIVTNCIVHGVLDDIQPHSYGLLMNNELVGVMLGTKEKFPKIWQPKELQPIQGPVAVNFFSLMADMQLGAMSKSQGRMKGYQLVTCRIFCVKTELRRKGCAAALLSASITNAQKHGAEAFYFTAPNKASQQLASKINLKEYNYIKYESYSRDFPMYKKLEDKEEMCKGYLALFKPF